MIRNDQNIKTIGAKLVMKGADKYRKRLRCARKEVQKFNNCIQLANQNVERLEKSMKEFGKINTDGGDGSPDFETRFGRNLRSSWCMSVGPVCGSGLGRKEINRRTAVALMDFVEKVSSGKSSTGKDCPARDEEIAVLPTVVKVLLEISQRLPG